MIFPASMLFPRFFRNNSNIRIISMIFHMTSMLFPSHSHSIFLSPLEVINTRNKPFTVTFINLLILYSKGAEGL